MRTLILQLLVQLVRVKRCNTLPFHLLCSHLDELGRAEHDENAKAERRNGAFHNAVSLCESNLLTAACSHYLVLQFYSTTLVALVQLD